MLSIQCDLPMLVLVAHNGFLYDFPILLAEIERRTELAFSLFIGGNVHFSDTLPLLRKVYDNIYALILFTVLL